MKRKLSYWLGSVVQEKQEKYRYHTGTVLFCYHVADIFEQHFDSLTGEYLHFTRVGTCAMTIMAVMELILFASIYRVLSKQCS